MARVYTSSVINARSDRVWARIRDFNGMPDAYLYTNVRDITLVQSVEEKAVPLLGGGENPSMSFYANYIVFDSPAPLGSPAGAQGQYLTVGSMGGGFDGIPDVQRVLLFAPRSARGPRRLT